MFLQRLFGTSMKINEHQFAYDTKWRQFWFVVNQGNLFKYLWNRYEWYYYPMKFKVKPAFPLHVDFELSSACNLRCNMCYTITDYFKEMVKKSFMDIELFKKGIDECAAAGVYSIRLSWRGEPSLHPKFLEAVHYAKVVKKIPNVSFLTNGVNLEGAVAEAMIDDGVDYISVSFDGTGDIYNSIRKPSIYEEALERLRKFRELRAKKGKKKPVIRVTSIWPAIAQDIERFKRDLVPVTDKIVCNPYIDFHEGPKPDPNFVCQYPWQRLTVSSNGSIVNCSGDNCERWDFGNLKNTTLTEAWHSPKMKELREAHMTGKRMEIPSCAVCRHGNLRQGKYYMGDWKMQDYKIFGHSADTHGQKDSTLVKPF